MELTEELKKRIDSMSYGELLSLWRFAAVGTPLFLGASGDYFAKRLSEMRDKVGDEEHVATSKRLGWGA